MEKINKKLLAFFVIQVLLYDCLFINVIFNAEQRSIYSLFPPKFYQIVLSQSVVFKHKCYALGSCETSELSFFSVRICYCDSACMEYGDCCYDALRTDNSTPGTSSLHDKNKFMSCEIGILSRNYTGLWMVSKCPFLYTVSEISAKCAAKDILNPVSADDGITYRNVYCAFCHNISQYTVWRFEFEYGGKCSKYKSLNTTIPNKMKHFIDKKCSYRFIPSSNANFRSCFIFTTQNEVENDLCSRFQNPLHLNGKLYKNENCINESRTAICVNPFRYRGLIDSLKVGMFDIYPALDLFGSKTCHNNKFRYDENTDTCVPETCIESQTETCVSELIRNYDWGKHVSFVSDNIIDKDFILRLSTFVYLSLPIDVFNLTLSDIITVYACGTNITDESKPCCTANIALKFKNRIEMREENILKRVAELQEMKWQYQEIKNKTMVTAIDTTEHINISDTCAILEERKTNYIKGIQLDTIRSAFADNTKVKPSKMIPKRIKGLIAVSSGTNEATTKTENDEIQMIKSTNGRITKIRFEQFELEYSNITEIMIGSKGVEGNYLSAAGTIFTCTTCVYIVFLCLYISSAIDI